MGNITELVNGILEETKRQENLRKEYLSLVHDLIEKTERKEDEFVWRISFHWCSCTIQFRMNISERINQNITEYDKEELEKANDDINKCINRLLDYGVDVADDFIEYLTKIAIPQFLQGRYPFGYSIPSKYL